MAARLRRLVHLGRRALRGDLPRYSTAFLKRAGFNLLATGTGQASMFAATLIVSNLLAVSDFGRYALITTTITAFATTAQLGFGVTLNRNLAVLRESRPVEAGGMVTIALLLTLGLTLLMGSAAILSGATGARLLFDDAAYGPALAIAGLALPFASLALMQTGVFNGLDAQTRQARLTAVLAPLVIALPALGAWWHGWLGAIAGFAAIYLLRAAGGWSVLRRILRRFHIPVPAPGWRRQLGTTAGYALPLTLGGLIITLSYWGVVTLLARQPGGEAEVGLFAAAFAVRAILVFLPAQSSGVLLATLSRLGAQTGGAATSRRILLLSTALGTGLVALLAALGALFAPLIASAFGAGFREGADVLRIMLLAAVVESAALPLLQPAQAGGRMWRSALTVILPREAAFVVTALLLAPELGALGVACAWLAAQAVGLAATLLLLARLNDNVVEP